MKDLAIIRNAEHVDQMPTARQQLLQETKEESAWYSGSEPTVSEIKARAYTIASNDEKRWSELISKLDVDMSTPTSPVYSPYRKPTNQALSQLAALGVDTSKGVDDDFYASNAWLKSSYRTGVSGVPQAPTSTSTKEQNAAYWYYKTLDAEETTRKAETEWAALQEEVAYWAGRADRNYSDDEVLGKIDWSSYPTLQKMDETAKVGTPLSLNRPISYTKDNLYGVLLNARNADSQYAPDVAAVKYRLGQGYAYTQNADIAAARDATSDKYNPYSLGATLDDAALYFGVNAFDKGWTEKNRDVLNGTDLSAQKFYKKVYAAEQTTSAAESELAKLNAWLDATMETTQDAQSILKSARVYMQRSDGCPTLMKLDESLQDGDLMDTTRAVNYTWKQFEQTVHARCEAAQKAEYDAAHSIEAMVATLAPAMKAQITQNMETQEGRSTEQRQMIAALMGDEMTQSERAYYKTNGNFTMQDMRLLLSGALSNSTIKAADSVGGIMQANNKAVAGEYTQARLTQNELSQRAQALTEEIAAITATQDMQLLDKDESGAYLYDPAYYEQRITEQSALLKKAKGEERAQIAETLTRYGAALDALDTLNNATDYAAKAYELEQVNAALASADAAVNALRDKDAKAQAIGRAFGLDASKASVLPTLDKAIDEYASYEPTVWSSVSAQQEIERMDDDQYKAFFGEALGGNADTAGRSGAVALYNKAVKQQNDSELKNIAWLSESLKANNVADETILQNIERKKAKLERDNADIAYYELRESADYAPSVQAGQAVELGRSDAGNTVALVYDSMDEKGVARKELRQASGGMDFGLYPYMTKNECETYFYLLSRGKDKADTYLEHLTDASYGVLPIRKYQETVEAVSERAASLGAVSAIGSTVASVFASPAAMLSGFAEIIGSKISGREINPTGEGFELQGSISAARETSKQQIVGLFPDASFGAKVADLVYDVSVAMGESLLYAGAGSITAPLVGTAALSANAMVTGVQDAKLRGADDNKALLYGGAQFAAEFVTEVIPMESLTDIIRATDAKGFKAALNNTLKQGATEFVGEAASEVLSSISDDAIMRELSNRNAYITYYMSAEGGGLTQEEAREKAARDIAGNILRAGAVGFLSGAGSAAVASISSQGAQTGGGSPVNDVILRNVYALSQAESAGSDIVSAQTLAAVLDAMPTATDNQGVVDAATQAMVQELGGAKSAAVVRDVLVVAQAAGFNTDIVTNAITTGALDISGEAHKAVANIAQNGATAGGVKALLEAAASDTAKANAKKTLENAVTQSKIAAKTAQALDEPSFLQKTVAAAEAVATTRKAVEAAKAEIKNAQKAYLAAISSEQKAAEDFTQAADAQGAAVLSDVLSKAIDNEANMLSKLNAAKKRLLSAHADNNAAQAEFAAVKSNELRRARERALRETETIRPDDVANAQEPMYNEHTGGVVNEENLAAQEQGTDRGSQEGTVGLDNGQHVGEDHLGDDRGGNADTGDQGVLPVLLVEEENGMRGVDGIAPASSEIVPPPVARADDGANGARPQRQFGTQTAQASDALHEQVKAYLWTHSDYTPDTNRAQIDRSLENIQVNGFDGAMDSWLKLPANQANTADNQAMGITLMAWAAQSGNAYAETQIADRYNELGTQAGQALQARKAFNIMTPLGAYNYVKNTVRRINDSYAEKKRDTRVILSQETAESILHAQTLEERQGAVDNAMREIAAQMPPSWKEMLTAWRYLAMLGNPRTMVRNLVGNVGQVPLVAAKNRLAAGIEAVAAASGLISERTKSLRPVAEKQYRDYATQNADESKSWLLSNGKYVDKNAAEAYRRSFREGWLGNILEGASGLVDKGMNEGDWLFLRGQYERAMAGWLQANKVDLGNITKAQMTAAQAYASKEAWKATYRDKSEFVNALNNAKHKNKGIRMVVNAVMPFTKTPVNILKRGIEYSPVGLVDSIARGAYKLSRGQISATEFIDGISAGLVGSTACAVGYFLAKAGLLVAGFGDDEDKEKLIGRQPYAIEVNGKSYTIDWAAPSALPVLVGGELYSLLSKTDAKATDVYSAILGVADPVMEMTMLSSLNDVLSGASYEENKLVGIAEDVAASLLGQFIPTLFGQIARSTDTTRRTVITKDTKGPLKEVQYFIGKTMNKLPYISTFNEPYVNAWGEIEKQEGFAQITWNAVENFFSPGYLNNIEMDDVEIALEALEAETGESLFPTIKSRKFKAGGENVVLTPEEYTRFKITTGQTSHAALESMFSTPEFYGLATPYQVKAVKDAYTYAATVAKIEARPAYQSSAQKWVLTAIRDDDPGARILNRAVDAQREETTKEVKEKLAIALSDKEASEVLTCIETMRANGRTDAQIKTDVSASAREMYKTAYTEGDLLTMAEYEELLLSLNIGFTTKQFSSWQTAADKE